MPEEEKPRILPIQSRITEAETEMSRIESPIAGTSNVGVVVVDVVVVEDDDDVTPPSADLDSLPACMSVDTEKGVVNEDGNISSLEAFDIRLIDLVMFFTNE